MNEKKKPSARTTISRHPIADRLIKQLRSYMGAKVVDFGAVVKGRQNAKALQEATVLPEDLADHHIAHALYVYAQNQTSVIAEQLMILPEMRRFAEVFEKAEEEYMPSGPPMSPLTKSFYTTWMFYDVGFGRGHETLCTITMEIGKALGMNADLIRIMGLLQNSRMAVYVHEGLDQGKILLRELVTNQTCKAICPAGYDGRAGEIWYARVLPPPQASLDEHVVFTTPYILLNTDEREWLAYFDRNLPKGPANKRITAYERLMKRGPERTYWTEFVFEAYVNYKFDRVFLGGFPDIPESRPHSAVNSSRYFE